MGEKKPPSVTKTREVETVGRRTGQADMAEEGRQEAFLTLSKAQRELVSALRLGEKAVAKPSRQEQAGN